LTQHPIGLSKKEPIREKSYSPVDLKYISYIHCGMKQNLKLTVRQKYTKFEICKIDYVNRGT